MYIKRPEMDKWEVCTFETRFPGFRDCPTQLIDDYPMRTTNRYRSDRDLKKNSFGDR